MVPFRLRRVPTLLTGSVVMHYRNVRSPARTAIAYITVLMVHFIVVPIPILIHVRLQVVHLVDYMDDEEHKSKISLYVVAVLAVIVVAIIAVVAVGYHTKTVPVTTSTTSAANSSLRPPIIAGAHIISVTPAPLIQQLKNNLASSYLAVYSFPNNSNETLIIRMLRYSNNNSAYNAYLLITNYTFNSTAISMPALPSGYAGIYITSQPGGLYSITTHKGVYTVTATLLGSNENLSNAKSYLEQVIAAALRQA